MKTALRQPDLPPEAPLEFLRSLWGLNHGLERASSRMRRTTGVTAQQRFVARSVGKYPGLTAGQLAGFLHLDPGTVSSTLRRLEAQGLLERRRDARDGRRVTVGLTAKGRQLDVPSAHTVESAVTKLLAATDPGDIEATKRVLEAFTRLLDSEAS